MGDNINYERIAKITVKSQAEFDMIPDDFQGRIYIEFGVRYNRAVVNRAFRQPVVARGNSSVEARDNSSVVACGNSSVVARGNSSVEACDNSSVEARDNSSVEARGNSSVEAWGNSSVVACGNSSVEACDNSSVVAWSDSSVEARDNSSVEARDNSSVEARDNSSVEAWDNSSVVACGNVRVVDRHPNTYGRIEVSGNARIVYMPKTIAEFMSFYGIKHDKKRAIFYKAVHHTETGYEADADGNFIYEIGGVTQNDCDPDVYKDCSYGIHIAHLAWALSWGRNWHDLAILEVETDIDDVVLPVHSNGKVRTSKVKVLREVPLEECGVYGKILARRVAGRS